MILLKIFLAVFIPVLLFSLYSRKFNNPFQLFFLMGKKGSGKSTVMVKKMLKYLRRGWHVYTDMSEVIVPGVRLIKAKDLEIFAPTYHSVVFLGEVGITYDNRHHKEFPDGIRDLFKFERKYKFRCYMDSQSYDIDKKLRDLVDGVYLQSNVGNVIGISRPIRRSVEPADSSQDSNTCFVEKLTFAPIWKWEFTWLPRYFKYFDSFSAPRRPPIPFVEVDASAFNAKKELRKLNRKWRKNK